MALWETIKRGISDGLGLLRDPVIEAAIMPLDGRYPIELQLRQKRGSLEKYIILKTKASSMTIYTRLSPEEWAQFISFANSVANIDLNAD